MKRQCVQRIEVTEYLGVRPVQGIEKRSKPNQNNNTVRPGSNISTRNVTTINLNPGTTCGRDFFG